MHTTNNNLNFVTLPNPNRIFARRDDATVFVGPEDLRPDARIVEGRVFPSAEIEAAREAVYAAAARVDGMEPDLKPGPFGKRRPESEQLALVEQFRTAQATLAAAKARLKELLAA